MLDLISPTRGVDFFSKAGSPGLSNSTEPTSPDSLSTSPKPACGSPERNLKNSSHAYIIYGWMDGWMDERWCNAVSALCICHDSI